MADFLLSFIRLLHSHVIFCSSQQTVTMFLRYFWINFFLSQEFEQILRPIIILLISILNISRLRSRLDRFFDTSNPFMTSEKEHFFFNPPNFDKSFLLPFRNDSTISRFHVITFQVRRMPTSAAYVWAIPLLQRLMHVNAASNEQVQLFIHELIDPFQSSTLIIGEQMVSTRRAPCESRGVRRGVGEAGKK